MDAHQLPLVGEHDQEDECGRHQHDGEKIGVERNRQQWRTGNEDNGGGSDGYAQVEAIETLCIAELPVKAVRTLDGLAQRLGGASGDGHDGESAGLD